MAYSLLSRVTHPLNHHMRPVRAVALTEDNRQSLRLEGVEAGPTIVSAWRAGKPAASAGPSTFLTLVCPHCLEITAISQSVLGTELPCPQCGKLLQINPFIINADWRLIARAWGQED